MGNLTSPISCVWLRRDLRLHDHAALHQALLHGAPVQPVFIFDTDILAHFPNADDRRLPFIATQLSVLHANLKKRGGGLLILHGKPQEIYAKLQPALNIEALSAAEDYEPAAIARDKEVGALLSPGCDVRFVKDQLVCAPMDILREGMAYKVYTPYSKQWKNHVRAADVAAITINDKGRYADYTNMVKATKAAGINVLDADGGAAKMLDHIGYSYRDDTLWPAVDAQTRLTAFIKQHATDYKTQRDFMAVDGTSRLSPYLRFGLVSVRECVKAAMEAKAETWLNELIWREFYAMILFHYPESIDHEWNPKYRNMLAWANTPAWIDAWKEGKTGYPVVDAAMRQLKDDGWMHNRARMIVASFFTKHLRCDWRIGEAHFAQYLMDYEMASNVGGWQWAASTGTDAQPYFRVFSPMLQSEKFDPKGDYIRRYVPELAHVKSKAIHAPWESPLETGYLSPIVEHKQARQQAIDMFKKYSD